eukprot:scaffold158351_cov15-Tisochrysis_lutea.AAC.2
MACYRMMGREMRHSGVGVRGVACGGRLPGSPRTWRRGLASCRANWRSYERRCSSGRTQATCQTACEAHECSVCVFA